MNNIRRGLIAGLLAGLIVAVLNFMTVGSPGSTLPAVAGWFGLNVADGTVSRVIGFLLLIILGGVFGLLFGFLQRDRVISLSRAIGMGLVVGAIWWFIFVLVLGSFMHQGLPFRANPSSFLSFFLFILLYLLYGLLLGTIYFQSHVRREV
jgi:hypothetical protein